MKNEFKLPTAKIKRDLGTLEIIPNKYGRSKFLNSEQKNNFDFQDIKNLSLDYK